jgi:hypothetical protein
MEMRGRWGTRKHQETHRYSWEGRSLFEDTVIHPFILPPDSASGSHNKTKPESSSVAKYVRDNGWLSRV